MTAESASEPVALMIPVYDDWESVTLLMPQLDAVLIEAGLAADVWLVDDGSTLPPPASWTETTPPPPPVGAPPAGSKADRVDRSSGAGIGSLRIVKLRRNVGHQRAICVGLCHLEQGTSYQTIVIMDGDGEDAPEDVPRLVMALASDDQIQVAFAERTRRSEGLVFRIGYRLYKGLHRVLVGHRIRVGNFSAIDRRGLESLTVSSELWSHYAAAVFAIRLPRTLIPTRRAKRLAGRSKMNVPNLVMHGLAALSVFSDRIATRLLMLSSLAIVVTGGGLVAVVVVRLVTGLAIPGWATTAAGILLVLLVQVTTFMLTFSFLVLLVRGTTTLIPARDCPLLIRGVTEVPHERIRA